MDQVIGEHTVRATVDDCYVLARQVGEEEDLLLEFDGELDTESGAFFRVICGVDVSDNGRRVRIGSLDFTELPGDQTLFVAYERMEYDELEAPNSNERYVPPGETDYFRRVTAAVVRKLEAQGALG